MTAISVSRDIRASSETVWNLLVDMDSWVEVIQAIEVVERLDAVPGFGVGTRWRETRTMFGKKATEEMEVTECIEGVSYSTAAQSHGSNYFSQLRVQPLASGCRLTMEFRGEPQTAFTKIMDRTLGRFFIGTTKKALAKDLDDIAGAAEAAES